MAEFKLDRLRFTWKGDWATDIDYTKDDIVRYESKSYVCLKSHTSSIFYDDLEYINTLVEPDVNAPKWVLWFDGYTWTGSWLPNTDYNLGDIVQYGGTIYVCNTHHTSATTAGEGLEPDAANWTSYAKTDNWLNNWDIQTQYKVNDIVRYNGVIYRCIMPHVSSNTVAMGIIPDLIKWEVVTTSQNWKNQWTVHTLYFINDTVRYGGIVYTCITQHTSASTNSIGLEYNIINWQITYEGIDHKGIWEQSIRYKQNDLVKYGANLWICSSFHTSIASFEPTNWSIYVPGLEFRDQWSTLSNYIPGDIVRYGGYSYYSKTHNTNQIPPENAGSWSLLTQGYKIQGEWDILTIYQVGDVVRRHGQLYVAILNNVGYETTDVARWALVISGSEWHNIWNTGTSYVIGDLATYYTSTYRCILTHVSNNTNNPVADTAGTYWITVVTGDLNEKMFRLGDTRYYDNGSEQRLPGGSVGQILKSSNVLPGWDSFGPIGYVYYVSPIGVDDPTSGLTLNSTFKTISYACNFVKLGTQNQQANYLLTQNKDWAVAEMYSWMLSQKSTNTAPFTTSSVFDQAKTYRDAGLVVDAVSYDLSRGGNSQTVTTVYTYFQPGTNTFFNTTVAAEMPYFIAALTRLRGLIVNGIMETSPTQTYQSAKSKFSSVDYTAEIGSDTIVTDLFNIIITALTAQSTSSVPRITFGLQASIFVKTGTYNEVLPITVPADTALIGDELRSTVVQPATGYEASNMFFVRNGSGIRNMSLKGLSGTLGEANSYLTKRPSAGAFVSLDPGTGPSDSSVWITTRSPYIQNVSTFGTGCVGLKIDGSLHASGNKSVVANDFTQILSDGIGVWCTGSDALTELVSVFSYYGHIGYLSEAGGKIRATNGNSSYGAYGTVAEGYDTNETPLTGTVNNRNQQAQIYSVFAGQAQNKILLLEYSNAGQNYSAASFSFSGAGTNALAVADEFRDSAIYEVRLRGSDYSAGGSNYITAGNQAQDGNETTITIAANDTSLASKYVGMRIILTSGTGVGQYGYIQAYDDAGKVVTVYKESTNTAGWDHVVPGTTIALPLDSTTVYSIEPRVTFSTPAYTLAGTGSVVNILSVVIGNNLAVGIGGGTGSTVVQYSSTGTAWTSATLPAGVTSLGSTTIGFASATNRFIVGSRGAKGEGGYSTNGVSWTDITLPHATAKSGFISAGDKVAYFAWNGSTRTNLLTYSEDFTNAVWVKSTVTASASPIISPDGITTATLLTGTLAGTVNTNFIQKDGIGVTASATYTGTVYVKQGSSPTFTFNIFSQAPFAQKVIVFNFLSGTITAGDSGAATVMALSNGWYKLTLTIVNNASTLLCYRYYTRDQDVYNVDGDSVYVWGAQLETGSRATGYMKSVASQGTATTELVTTTDGVTWNALGSPATSSYNMAYGAGTYVITNNTTIYYAYNGLTWNSVTVAINAHHIAYGNGRFVTLEITAGTTNALYSFDGITWTAVTLPYSNNWTRLNYGQGIFVAVGDANTNTLTSIDGINWTLRSVAAFTLTVSIGSLSGVPTMIGVDASATFRTVKFGTPALGRVTIGSGKVGVIKLWNPGSGYDTTGTIAYFVASISGSTMSVTNTISGTILANMIISGGNGGVAANTTITSINEVSFNGFISNTALTVTSTLIGGSLINGTVLSGFNIVQGTMVTGSQTAVFTGSISQTTLTVSAMTSGVIYPGMKLVGGAIPASLYIVSNISGAGTNSTWTVSTAITQSSTSITGTRYTVDISQTASSTPITGRSYTVSVSQTVVANNLQGASSSSTPVVNIFDPNSAIAAITNCRIGNGVLGNPSFANRGNNYQTSTTEGTVTGNGFADTYPITKFITVSGLSLAPTPGSSLIIAGSTTQFKIVSITNLTNGTYYLQIGPPLTRLDLIEHNTAVEIRQKYSQVRLTGHDYLLIGTGNKESTNFPNVDTTNSLNAYQVQENNQGRVFVTSTDQDGNFKVGGLFGVEQATGTVTVSADLFNLAGLNEITLGGVQIGQNTVTITQFSTDPYFIANSDNIVPTQKAVKSYLARLISAGGANAKTSILVAGTVGVGPAKIFSTTDETVIMNNTVKITGGIDGTMLAMALFARSFRSDSDDS
jgi:hypothetical protein